MFLRFYSKLHKYDRDPVVPTASLKHLPFSNNPTPQQCDINNNNCHLDEPRHGSYSYPLDVYDVCM